MSAATASTACIGEPISWLRLEQFAVSRTDGTVSEHVEKCPACRACLDEIARDVVALPPLAIPEKYAKARRPWWTFAIPAGLALAAAALLLLVLRPRDATDQHGRFDRTQIKGLGTVELSLVRERAGVVRTDVATFATGDRWKVLVTCAAGTPVWVDAFVVEAGATAADYPLEPAEITCGNDIALPGAFEITGAKTNTVCVRVSTDGPPPRALAQPGEPGVACIEIHPG